MIELENDQLTFRFPEVEEALQGRLDAWFHAKLSGASKSARAQLASPSNFLARTLTKYGRVQASVTFMRTLRIPDDGKDYPLPPGLGSFRLKHVDDVAGFPSGWRKTGGVALPMHRAEAMWLSFRCSGYPLILRVAAGGVCAVSGQPWATGLTDRPQNYLSLMLQPWLDGFRIDENTVRQFIAVQLGKGLTVEGQLTGEESWGGLQLQAFPLKLDRYWQSILPRLEADWRYAVAPVMRDTSLIYKSCVSSDFERALPAVSEMGLGAGGKMQQEICQDDQGIDAWDRSISNRCYVRLCLADDWFRLTGEKAPHEPPTAKDYTQAGLPWFSYDSDAASVAGHTNLTGVSSVNALMEQKVGIGLPDNQPLSNIKTTIIKARNPNQVREF